MDEGEREEDKKEEDSQEPEEKPEKPVEPSKKTENLTNKLRENPFILSTLICGVLAVLLLVTIISGGGITGKVVSGEEAGENLVEYLNKVADSEITLIEVEDEGNFYLITIEFKDEEMPIYVTKDGKYYTSTLLPLISSEQEEESQDVPKSDKPEVELFIMTHCPFGTQAEKGMIPVIEEIGDLTDIKIRFVHYFMHEPEETETPRQVCIREEQSEKWLDYLRCFLEGDGNADANGYIKNNKDSETCRKEVGIDESKLANCIKNNAGDYYETDSDLSEGYGIQGSPGLVINGVKIEIQKIDGKDYYMFNDEKIPYSRSPDTYKQIICSLFNTAPEECSQSLSSSSPSPGFGWEGTSSASGQC